MIFEILDLEDNVTSLPVDRIQFLWQKQTFDDPNRLVTQIVYKTDTVAEEKGLLPFFSMHTRVEHTRIIGRAVIDSPLSLDSWHTMLRSSNPPIRTFWLRRAFTNGDSRVMAVYPSEFFEAVYQYVLPLNDLSEEGYALRKNLNETLSRTLGGDGKVVDVPLGWAHTYDKFHLLLMGHPITVMAAFNIFNSRYREAEW